MLKHTEITTNRLQSFKPQLKAKLYGEKRPAKSISVYNAPGRIPFQEAIAATFKSAKIGDSFGPGWATHWFKVDLEIPEEFAGKEVHLIWDSNSEALIWSLEGEPLQGLLGSGGNDRRTEFILTRCAPAPSAPGSPCLSVSFYVEMACNGMFGNGDWGVGPNPPDPDKTFNLSKCEVAVFDRDAWDLYYDFVVIAECAKNLPSENPRQSQALYYANQMCNLIDVDDRCTWPAAREVSKKFFSAHVGGGQHTLSATGHCHIDTAWLWPYAETIRKCARSWATQTRYMDLYPDYVFTASQAQQYEWVKERYPGLYQRIKDKIAEGRFVPIGGTWVEMDCNIPSGESLVRQFLFGQKFFRSEFGSLCKTFWLPDTFGYSAQLPQIMKAAGIDYFLTQKLSWNQVNKFPHTTFLWQGIDGTKVLTHFPPADTYCSQANVTEVNHSVKNNKDKERAEASMLVYGHGDGGGGPTMDQIEQLARMRDVDGLPRVQMRSPETFFETLDKEARDLCTWSGELYFEFHRGTYTTQAKNKLHNRRCEFLLHDIECTAALASILGDKAGHAYPTEELSRLWKLVLLNQFHDVIPGSSIHEVYEDSARHYADVEASGAKLLDSAVSSIFGGSSKSAVGVAVNTQGFDRVEVVELPSDVECEGAVQKSANGKPLAVARVPSIGLASVSPTEAPSDRASLTKTADSTLTLENAHLRAVFRSDGHLVSLVEKSSGKEAVAESALANHFVLFDDNPLYWDAWDVDVYHLEKRKEISPKVEDVTTTIIEEGPLRVSFEVKFALTKSSSLVQRVSLDAVSHYVRFDAQVEWHEAHKFLKVEFPLSISAPSATFEVPFGHVQRPTHFNTSWDMARFEVCAHKWADASEYDFGIALINDSKYGHAVHGNIMRLSLLRSPKAPDAECDMGTQNFSYALMPHSGSLQHAGVIQTATAFNNPLVISAAPAAVDPVSFYKVQGNGVFIDSVKMGESGKKEVVLRLYEAFGGRATVRVLTSLAGVTSASLCNLLEEEDAEVSWEGPELGAKISFTPFQIRTLKLSFE